MNIASVPNQCIDRIQIPFVTSKMQGCKAIFNSWRINPVAKLLLRAILKLLNCLDNKQCFAVTFFEHCVMQQIVVFFVNQLSQLYGLG